MVKKNSKVVPLAKEGTGWFFKNQDQTNSSNPEQPGDAQKKVDKSSRVPAYVQLANFLRSGIASGAYPPGTRLPAESALAENHGVSAMTARQAVSVLAEEGVIRRVQGKGTFVQKIQVSSSSFGLDTLREVFADQDNISVRILRSTIKKEPGIERDFLSLPAEQPVILVERIIFYRNEPFTLHVSYTSADPTSPFVESMLDTTVLTEMLLQEGYSKFKRGVLHLVPTQLDEHEAELLNSREGQCVFKLEHLFFDFRNQPAAYGWFILDYEKMPLTSRIGVWDE